jgi:hypothetical protein
MWPTPSKRPHFGQSLTLCHETVVESVPRDLDLTLAEAQALVAVGRSLALSPSPPVDEAEAPQEATVVRCTMTPNGRWRLIVSDAVGLISVGDLRIVVEPKIPRPHLFHLFSRADLLPRLATAPTASLEGEDLWELLCRWLVEACEQVLRRDLVRDYFLFHDTIAAARGEIEAVATAEQYYRGDLRLTCTYEEFGSDTELNRLLKAAAHVVTGSPDASASTRRRAARISGRMEDVGPLGPTDLRVTTDRRTAHYRDAVLLARSILSNVRRTLAHGAAPAWTFLIRTPDLVEAGVRKELQERIQESWNVRKKTFPLTGARMSVAPDLVFGDVRAVGDVKYKRVLPLWRRPDLYEVTTFAAAARAPLAAVIGFRADEDPEPPRTVGVGDTQVRFIAWDARRGLSPEQAAAQVAESVSDWLLSENPASG